MKRASKFFIFLCVTIFLSFSLQQTRANALIERQFGGKAIMTIPCTCSLPNFAIWFTPLYLGGPVVSAGPLVYSPSTITHEIYAPGTPMAWHLGKYLPGVQACFIYVGVACVPLPTLGLITRVGMGLPSF